MVQLKALNFTVGKKLRYSPSCENMLFLLLYSVRCTLTKGTGDFDVVYVFSSVTVGQPLFSTRQILGKESDNPYAINTF